MADDRRAPDVGSGGFPGSPGHDGLDPVRPAALGSYLVPGAQLRHLVADLAAEHPATHPACEGRGNTVLIEGVTADGTPVHLFSDSCLQFAASDAHAAWDPDVASNEILIRLSQLALING